MCIRDSLHRGLLIHAEHDGLFRRVEVEANDVDQLFFEPGIVGQLDVFTRCGLRPRPDQIRCTVAGLTSLAFAIDRQLQCVSPSGRPSCVSRTISSTLLAGIDGLRPRPLATRPNSRNPSAANRLRQPTTVLTATPHSAAILALATPSPASSRALDRTTSRCAAEVDLDNLCNVWRCPSGQGKRRRWLVHSSVYRKTSANCNTLHQRRTEQPLRAGEVASRVTRPPAYGQASGANRKIIRGEFTVLRELGRLVEAPVEVRRPRADLQRCRAARGSPLDIFVGRRVVTTQRPHAGPLEPATGVGVRTLRGHYAAAY